VLVKKRGQATLLEKFFTNKVAFYYAVIHIAEYPVKPPRHHIHIGRFKTPSMIIDGELNNCYPSDFILIASSRYLSTGSWHFQTNDARIKLKRLYPKLKLFTVLGVSEANSRIFLVKILWYDIL
jgi:hypothetical protein